MSSRAAPVHPAPTPESPLSGSDEPLVELRQTVLVSRKGTKRVGQLVEIGEDEACIVGLEGVFPGTDLELQLQLPVRKTEITLRARVTTDDRSGPAGEPPVTRLRLLDPPAELREDIERIVELHRIEPPEKPEIPEGIPDQLATRYDVHAPLQPDEAFSNFQGFDKSSGEPVLIRILDTSSFGGERWKKAFSELLASARRVEHPNVLRVMDFVETDDRIGIVCQHARAPRLTTVLSTRGALEIGIVHRLTKPILAALEATRQQGLPYGIVHPGRVRLGSRLTVGLADLVVAQMLPTRSIAPEDIALAYAPPEVRLGEEPTERSEIHAVGMLVYAMLIGGCPYEPSARPRLETEPALAPVPPDRAPVEIPPGIVRWITRAIAPDPDDRFDSIQELATAYTRAAEGPGEDASPPTGEAAQRRILVVDDEPEIRNLLRSVLQTAGHEVILASNGIEGLETAFREPVDLICLDVRMPQMDGVEMCMVLKQDPRTQDIPVLVITAYDTEESRGLMGSVGGTRMMSKPFDVPDLIETVAEMLEG